MGKKDIMSQVVIIGQNYSTSLSLIRSLGEAGYICHVVQCGPGTTDKLVRSFTKPDVFSRYVKKGISVSRKNKEHIISRIIGEFGNSSEQRILLPADDFCAALLSEFEKKLQPFFHVPNIQERTYNLYHVMCKCVQKQMAAACGISVAKNWEVKIEFSQSPVIPKDVIYPCIAKPAVSIGLPKSYIQRCDSQEQLLNLLSKISQNCSCTILLEQYINVEKEYTIPGISDGNNVYIPAFIKKSLVSEGEHKGVTIRGVVEDSSRYQEIRNLLTKFIVSTGFCGIFDIELFYSHGSYYLNEINFRNGAAAYALTCAGINLPAMWVYTTLNGSALIITETPLKELTFVSDKAAFEYMLAGFCSYFQYRKILKATDVLLIGRSKDWTSSLAFSFLKLNLLLKKVIKWIIKHN